MFSNAWSYAVCSNCEQRRAMLRWMRLGRAEEAAKVLQAATRNSQKRFGGPICR